VALNANVDPTPASLLQKAPSAALFVVDDVWMGAMVPKRWAKRAVTRNAIKRQIYTVGQEFEPGLAKVAHLVRLRAGFDKAQFQSATSEALKAAVRLELQRLFEKVVGLRTPLTAVELQGSAA
jgi:ribonuclease P protein component